MSQHTTFSHFIGHFTGKAKTWFEPGKLADEQAVALTGAWALNDRFLRITYHSALLDKALEAELIIGYDPNQARYEGAWLDSAHMGRAMLHLLGNEEAGTIRLDGSYFAGADQPRWGWQIQLLPPTAENQAQRIIQMYNAMPGGEPALAVAFELQPV